MWVSKMLARSHQHYVVRSVTKANLRGLAMMSMHGASVE